MNHYLTPIHIKKSVDVSPGPSVLVTSDHEVAMSILSPPNFHQHSPIIVSILEKSAKLLRNTYFATHS